MGFRAELMEDRRVLRNVGGNLNDVARIANTDGTLGPMVERVLERVVRAVARIDCTVEGVDALVGQARSEVVGRRRSV